ncbi:MAG: hypothetical protein ABJB47_22470 [Actinomycetota bacterium]
MKDLKDLLERGLDDGHGPVPGQPVDPAGDLARGHQRLRRRRGAALAAVAGAAACAVVVSVAVTGGSPAAARHQAAGAKPPATARPSRPATPLVPPSRSIALVTYTGQQAPGYQVAKVPEGWVIQGGDPFHLTIAAKDDPDKQVDSFTGKLVVMLQSRDASNPAGQGSSQPVAGRPGRYDVQGDTQILTYQDAKKHFIVIQAPTMLGWDSARLAQFAAGVQVLGNAQPGRG